MTRLVNGYTLMHEHMTLDLSGVKQDPDCQLICYSETKAELIKLYNYGVRNIVDVTNRGMGRNPDYVNQLSSETGINIIQSTGFYKIPFLPTDTLEKSINELADEMIRDISIGIEKTTIKAGVIGEIGTSLNEWKDEERKIFEAAVKAHRATNAPIYTHTTLGTLGLEQAYYFLEHHVNPRKVVIGHMDLSQNLEAIKRIAALGFFVGFDTIGKNNYVPDSTRIEYLVELQREKLLSQVVLSEDLTRVSHLAHSGGIGYSYLFESFLPELRIAGLSESSIDQMLIHNPLTLFEV